MVQNTPPYPFFSKMYLKQDGGAIQNMSEVRINMPLYPNNGTNNFKNGGLRPPTPLGIRDGDIG